MAKMKITTEDLALKIDKLANNMDKGFKDMKQYVDGGLEQVVLPKIQNVQDDVDKIKDDITDHRLQTNRIEGMLKSEIIRHDDHSIRIERLEKKSA